VNIGTKVRLQMMSDVPPKNLKDRHRRRPPQIEEPDYFSDVRGNTKSSTGEKSNSKFAPEKKQTTDPWKILVKKLDTTKGAKEKFGKVIVAKVDNTIDELKCIHFDSCAGCSMKGNFSDAPIVKRARSFFASENLKFPTTLANHTGWRTHVKLAVRPLSRWGGLKIGLFKAGSHDVEAIPDCRVHHPRINEAVEELRRAAMEVGVKGYQEASGGNAASGELRYIQMSVERETQKVQIVLVWNVFTFKEAEQTLPRLVKRLKGKPDLWHSVYVNFQTSASNVILNYNAKAWKLLWGPPALKEKVGNANFFFAPQIFRQVSFENTVLFHCVFRHQSVKFFSCNVIDT
jgi:tRNA/tmRNA/rRNA uracil-C5-methylase (TrmA/RlmC/RlmD family)